MDALHRILTGQALTPRQLAIGGCVVAGWILMDVLQFCGIDGPTIVRLVAGLG